MTSGENQVHVYGPLHQKRHYLRNTDLYSFSFNLDFNFGLEVYHQIFKLPLIPSLPNALNRAHWAVKTKEKNAIHAAILGLTYKHKPLRPLHQVQLILTRCTARQPDFDNLAYSFKYVLDGLTKAKIIVDDNPNVLSDLSYRWLKTPQKLAHCLIEVIEK